MRENARAIKSNTIKYIIFQTLYGTALALTTGAIVLPFFEHLGLAEQASLYSSLIQIFQVVAMMACSLWCDRIKNIIKSVGISVCVTYFVAYIGVVAFGNCIPVLVYGGVPREVIGKYTAWRMLFFTLGSAIPGFFMNGLLESVGAFPVLLAGGVCTAACGVSYVLVFGKRK